MALVNDIQTAAQGPCEGGKERLTSRSNVKGGDRKIELVDRVDEATWGVEYEVPGSRSGASSLLTCQAPAKSTP